MDFDWSALAGQGMGTIMDWYIAGDMANTQQQNNLELQKLQHMYNRDMYRHRYQWTVEDMKAAGLNPILATSKGMQSTPSGVSSPTAGLPHMPAGFSSAYSQFASGEKSAAEAEKAKAEQTRILVDSSLKLEQQKEVIQNIIESRARTKKIEREESMISQRIFNLEQEFLIGAANIDKLRAEVTNIEKKTSVGHAQIEQINQQTINLKRMEQQIINNTRKLQAEIQKLIKISNVYAQPGGQVIAYVREILGALGLGAGIFFMGKAGKIGSTVRNFKNRR